MEDGGSFKTSLVLFEMCKTKRRWRWLEMGMIWWTMMWVDGKISCRAFSTIMVFGGNKERQESWTIDIGSVEIIFDIGGRCIFVSKK